LTWSFWVIDPVFENTRIFIYLKGEEDASEEEVKAHSKIKESVERFSAQNFPN
jgi:hypothetical protein